MVINWNFQIIVMLYINMDRKFEAVHKASNEKGENTIFFPEFGLILPHQNLVRNWNFENKFILNNNRLQI